MITGQRGDTARCALVLPALYPGQAPARSPLQGVASGHRSFDARAPHASYAILTRRGSHWSADIIHLAYDWDLAAARARANGAEAWARAYESGSVA